MRQSVADAWLVACQAIAGEVRTLVASMRQSGLDAGSGKRGPGGDESLALDLAAECAALRHIDRVAQALDIRAVADSEESGRIVLNGRATAAAFVSVDPVDGSHNVQSGIPFAGLSVAVSTSERLSGVEFGYVADLFRHVSYWAWRDHDGTLRGSSTITGGRRSGHAPAVVAIENAAPSVLADACASLPATVRAIRVLGSTAMSLVLLSTGGVDAVISAKPLRAFDVAAGQLVARAAGCLVDVVPADASLRAETRVSLVAASTEDTVASLKSADLWMSRERTLP
jgi:fructose-1,6-bisphosphatase/inositol monophosphatase family enzyme